MKYFREHIDEFSKIYKESENYIIFNDGKPIRENILNEEDVEVSLDESLDPRDICEVERCDAEKKLIKNAKFNVNVKIHKPLQLKLIHLNDDEATVTFSFEIDPKIEVKIIDIYTRVDIKSHILNEILVNDRAKLDYFSFSRCEKSIEHKMNVYIDSRANVNLYNLMANEDEYRFNCNVYLFDKFSKLNQYNTLINNTKKDQEFTYKVHHLAKSSVSQMRNNAICNSDSFIVVNTDGIIKKDAIETDLNQKIKGILLDEKSNIIANPVLHIDEYDCKAGHGAGVGAIDEADLFYLMSRGIEKNDAVKLIVYGYIEPVISFVKEDEELTNYISEIIFKKI
jgi:Fe-S cluster assembly protein SufD